MINASLQYDLISGNERHLFTINQQNGSLFLERELDLDTLPGNTFTLQVQAIYFNGEFLYELHICIIYI